MAKQLPPTPGIYGSNPNINKVSFERDNCMPKKAQRKHIMADLDHLSKLVRGKQMVIFGLKILLKKKCSVAFIRIRSSETKLRGRESSRLKMLALHEPLTKHHNAHKTTKRNRSST